MALPVDPNPRLAQYTHPERLVTTEWLAANLGRDGLVVVESDEDILVYATGHIPGAVHIDWQTELNDPVVRDYVDGAGFAALCGAKGIARETTVVIYGDKSNWWAAYALWVFTLFGHPDVRLLDGGHIPTAASVPWARAAAADGTFKARAELEEIYLAGAGLSADREAIAYCRIGERSSHTWFVLRFLLGLPKVRNYDGSWTEWGSSVGVPIVQGEAPGSIEAA